MQLLAERSQVRHEVSQARQLPPLSYRPCGGHVRNVRARVQAGSRGALCWVTLSRRCSQAPHRVAGRVSCLAVLPCPPRAPLYIGRRVCGLAPSGGCLRPKWGVCGRRVDSGGRRAHCGARGDARARGEGDAGHAREAAGVARAAAGAARRVTRDARGGATAAAAVVEVLAVGARADARAVVQVRRARVGAAQAVCARGPEHERQEAAHAAQVACP